MAKDSRLYKQLYKPMCRAYARDILGDRPSDRIYTFLFSLKFWKDHRYWPHLKNPRSFSEKVCGRMLFDRNPLWTMLSDKWRVREYVAQKVGGECLVPVLWHGERAEEIPFDELPSKFVIKASHGCKYNIIVRDKQQLDRTNAKQLVNKWLNENYCRDKFLGSEWAYKSIKPTIIVESFLDDNGRVPVDYKFFCFSGRAEFLQASFDRFGDASELILDRDFNPINVWNGLALYKGEAERPHNFGDMMRVAESLARGLDFIRVDLYSVGGRVYFGELTCYPASGMARFVPRKYDFSFGEKWNME
jgi:hypothetical protein